MDEIIFVTHNKGKMATAKKYLKDVKFKTYDYELDEPRSDDIKEISRVKVEEAYNIVKKPCIAMDSGFFINKLNGFPKCFVNFSLETIGIEGILKLMDGIEDRSCEFTESLSYYDGEKLVQFEGRHKGTLSKEILGNYTEKKWSDLWYIFIPEGYDKTLAQMSEEERENRNTEHKNDSSFASFAKWYKNNK